MLGFLAQCWQSIDGGDQDSWDDLAEAKQISPFNAYASENLQRWQDFLGPPHAYPAAQSANSITTTQVLTGGVGQITIENTPSGAGSNWGIVILRSAAEITTPDWTMVIAVLEANGTAKITHVDSPLTAGTYHYRSCVFNDDGTLGTFCVDDDEAAT